MYAATYDFSMSEALCRYDKENDLATREVMTNKIDITRWPSRIERRAGRGRGGQGEGGEGRGNPWEREERSNDWGKGRGNE